MLNSRPKTNLINKLPYYLVAFTGISIVMVVLFGYILTPMGGVANPSRNCYSSADPMHFTLYNILTPLSILLVIFLMLTFLFRRYKRFYDRFLISTAFAIVSVFGIVLLAPVFISTSTVFS